VKILFDADTPVPLARFLRGHEVVRADELGWQGLENGALLDAAEQAGFDLLLTCDQNVRYQQNFAGRKLALVILSRSAAESGSKGRPHSLGGAVLRCSGAVAITGASGMGPSMEFDGPSLARRR
jgi:hypothetical protein